MDVCTTVILLLHQPIPADVEAVPAIPAGLTEEQLLEVFKQTSMFNVRTALQNNEALLEDGEGGSYSDDDLSSDDGGDVMTGTLFCMKELLLLLIRHTHTMS